MSGDDQSPDGIEPTQDQPLALPKGKERAPGPATRALGRPTILGLDGQPLVEGVNLKNNSRASIPAQTQPTSSVKVEQPISATAREVLRQAISNDRRVSNSCLRVSPEISACQVEAVKATAAEIYRHLQNPDFSDLEIVCNLLERRSAAELKYLSAAYEAVHPGLTLEGDLKNARAVAGWSDGQNEKAVSLLFQGQQSAGQRDAAFVHDKLIQLEEAGRSANNRTVEQELRRTILQLNSKQIEAVERAYKEQGYGSLFVGLLTNQNVCKETREVLSIYLKGIDKRSEVDIVKLIDAALRKQDIWMFYEALHCTPESSELVESVIQEFLQAGGDQWLKEAFGRESRYRDQNGHEVVMYAESEELRDARALADPKGVCLADRILESAGRFQANHEAVERALENLTDAERSRYLAGQALADGLTAEQKATASQILADQLESELSPDKGELKYYLDVNNALREANRWCTQDQFERWEAMIANR
jgi:hypothetical protein